jgi:hypothetical protein
MLKRHLLHVAIALAWVAPYAAHAEGQNVHRCIGEHGEISFSGAPCAASASVLSGSGAPARSADRGIAAPTTCAASADALRDVIADAFARRDANTIAGVMRWDGVGGAAARERMRELVDLTGRPLLGIDIDNGAVGESAPGETEAAQLTVRMGSLEGGASEHAFRLMPSGGCYWLDW